MIEVRDLVKEYPGVRAVDGVSFDVPADEIVGFLGPNGSGKTTTMRILTTYLAPTSGTARVAGFDVVHQSLEVRRRVGYLPESNPLYTEMRVRDYLRYRGGLRDLTFREARIRADEAIELCGLREHARRVIGTLSKGLRQRVGLADAILHRPPIVILDEPTIGLDPNQVIEVRELIRQLGRERTVILSTHILSEVEAMCSRVMIMSAGRLVATGRAEEISRALGLEGRYRVVAGGDGRAIKDALDALEGVERVFWSQRDGLHHFEIETSGRRDLRARIFAMARDRRWDLRGLEEIRPSLEEIFKYVTSGAISRRR
jgi:ABC-2 type transport system ATP-binding protein